jgi:hypothetical protein
MRVRVLSLEEAIEDAPDIFDSKSINRRTAITTIGGGLVTAVSVTMPLPANAETYVGLAFLWLEKIAAAKPIWELGTAVSGYFFGQNKTEKKVNGMILVDLSFDGIVASQENFLISVEPYHQLVMKYDTEITTKQGLNVIRARSIVNSVQTGIRVL